MMGELRIYNVRSSPTTITTTTSSSSTTNIKVGTYKFFPALVPNKYSGVATAISLASGLPNRSQIPPPSVKIMYPSASRSNASFPPQASLSVNLCVRIVKA